MTAVTESTAPRARLSHRLADELRQWPATLKVGTGIITAVVLAGIFAPWLTPYDP
jgi:ABC-type dipeptide/oligopeptide/nickel transport system permease subunit